MKLIKKELLNFNRYCKSMKIAPSLHGFAIMIALHEKPGITMDGIIEELGVGVTTIRLALKSLRVNSGQTFYVVKEKKFYYLENYAKAYMDQIFGEA